MRVSAISLFFLLACSPLCDAQEEQPITTDRPSIGTGTDLVPRHAVEFENGFTLSRTQSQSRFDLPETLMRVGLASRVELRASLPNEHFQMGAPVSREDISFGVKLRLRSSQSAWPVSVTAGLSVPAGTSGLSSGGWDPSTVFSISHPFSQHLLFFASCSPGAVSLPQLRERHLLLQNAVDFGWSLTPRRAVYAEYAPSYDAHKGTQDQTVDAGTTWLLRRTVQLDARIGTTRSADSSTLFLSVGYSVRR